MYVFYNFIEQWLLNIRKKNNIFYQSGCSGDTSYHFRIRKEYNLNQHRDDNSPSHFYYGYVFFRYNFWKNFPTSILLETNSFKCCRCKYCFKIYKNLNIRTQSPFRQRKGEEFKRGYFQKSLVLITRKPYINLYSKIVEILAPSYFDSDQVAIEVAMHNFTCWGTIVPGKSYQVPLLGQVYFAMRTF